MKKFMTIVSVLLVSALLLSGCQKGSGNLNNLLKPSGQANNETNPYVPDYTIPEPWSQSYQDTLTNRIPFTIDMAAGWEYRDLTVNGVHRRITVTFEMDSSVISKDPCFTYYRVDMIGDGMYAETIGTGREFFSAEITEYVRSEDPDKINMELFEADFKAVTFKGKDKDYVVVSIPAGWDENSATIMIANDQGKLLADNILHKGSHMTLQGHNASQYMDSQGNANFFSFNEDSITYLVVSQKVAGITYLKEYSVSIENDEITLKETGKTYTTTDEIPPLPALSVH